MLGDAVLYAASRATSTAIGNVSRRAAWTAAAGAFLLCSLVSALIVVYWLVEPRVGTVTAVAIISGACLATGIICLSLPGMIERVERRARANGNASTAATTVAAVDEEAKRAADYLGAVEVVGAAFLFGLEAARELKR